MERSNQAGRVRVVVATTEGPSTVLRVTAEDPSLRSVVCLGRSTTTLPISRAYDAFVRSPSGIVERAVGHRAFRVDVSAPIDDGDSWQLGLYLAHLLKAAGRLAEDGSPAGLVLWASGRVDGDLAVHPVERLEEKLRRSAGLFATSGGKILVVAPAAQTGTQAVRPDNVEILAVGAVDQVLRRLGLVPRRRLGHRRGWAWRGAAAAAVVAGLVALAPWPPGRPTGSAPPEPPGAVEAWQRRPLDAVYPVVHFDSLRVAIRDGDRVRNAAAHVALGIAADGRREVLGAWVEGRTAEGFWPSVVRDLRARGVADLIIVVSEAPGGFGEAVGAGFPQAVILRDVVRMIRESAAVASSRDRRAAASDLKAVHQAASVADAARALDGFAARWGERYPSIAPLWRADWGSVEALLALPPAVRGLVTATGALDDLNRSMRRALDGQGGFAGDTAAVDALLQAARASGVDGRRSAAWSAAMAALRLRFGDRLPPAGP